MLASINSQIFCFTQSGTATTAGLPVDLAFVTASQLRGWLGVMQPLKPTMLEEILLDHVTMALGQALPSFGQRIPV